MAIPQPIARVVKFTVSCQYKSCFFILVQASVLHHLFVKKWL